MAVSTTPYQNNDYKAASNFRPYELPVNDIMKGLVAQNEFWDAGARVVKSRYEHALDLKLTNSQNKEIRDNFMKEAEKEITKLSSMNLADPSVQRQGIGIFKPLYKDEGILSDDQATRHIEKVNNDALTWRNKENGKYYSQTNHKYALFGSDEFKNSQDRMAGKKYLQEAKEFEQFYDPTTELSSILKYCKPDKASGETLQGMYITRYSEESLTAMKINSCLDAELSDKAKRQLQINGAVTYKNNPEALRDKYIPHLQGSRKSLSEQNAAYQGVLANKDNLKNLTSEQLKDLGFKSAAEITPDTIKRMQEIVKSNEDRISNYDATISKLGKGDMSPILGENFEQVAGTVYSRDYMQNVAEGFAYNFSENTMKADPIQMMYWNNAEVKARQEDDQAHDRDMKQMELDADRKTRSLEGRTLEEWNEARRIAPTNHPLTGKSDSDSYEVVTAKREEIAKLRTQLNVELDGFIKNPHKPGTAESLAFRNAYIKTAQGDPEKKKIIDGILAKQDNYIMMEDMYRNIQISVDSKIGPIAVELENKIKNIPAVQLKDQSVITAQDVQTSMKNPGMNVKGLIYTVPNGNAALASMTYKGKVIQPGISAQEDSSGDIGSKLLPLYHSVRDMTASKLSAIRKKRNEIMKQETVLQREVYAFPELNDDKKGFKVTLAQQIDWNPEDSKNMTVGEIDANGSVVVTVKQPSVNDKSYTVEDKINKLLNLGQNNRKVSGREDQVVLTGISMLDVIDETNINHMMAPYIRTLENIANPVKSSSTGYIRGGNGRSYRMEILPRHDGGFLYKIIDQSKPDSPVAVLEDRASAVRRFESTLKRNQPKVSTK